MSIQPYFRIFMNQALWTFSICINYLLCIYSILNQISCKLFSYVSYKTRINIIYTAVPATMLSNVLCFHL